MMSPNSPDQIFDELLVLQYKAGDSKALELLIKRWHPKIMRYAYRQTNNQQAAEDVSQEVWEAALKGIHRLAAHAKIGSWLISITHNKSMNWLKKNVHSQNEQSWNNSDTSENKIDERIEKMRKAILQLSTDHRNILSLFYLEGYSMQEITEISKISIGTVKSRLYYARESLKKAIKN